MIYKGHRISIFYFPKITRGRQLEIFWLTNLKYGLKRFMALFSCSIVKKPKKRLLPIFSPNFTLKSQIRLIYAEKWIFLKRAWYFNCLTSVPFAPVDIAENRVLKLVERFSGHCRANQVLKLTTKPFTGRTLRGVLIQMQNISLRSSGMRRKQNF